MPFKENIGLATIIRSEQSNGDAVVRALTFDQCGLGSISRLGVICWLSLLVLYSSALRGFSLTVLQSYPLLKNLQLI